MSKGVALLAIGREAYLSFAVNLACSIKFYTPGMPVQLIASHELIKRLKVRKHESVFDLITAMPDSDWQNNHKQLFAARAKLSMPEYFAFSQTAYFDVDSILFKPIDDLFVNEEYVTHVHKVYKMGDDMPQMYWCKAPVIMEHYGLDTTYRFPGINSSYALLKKDKAGYKVYQKALENLLVNPIPLSKHYRHWGMGTGQQPDELYLNIACAQLKTMPINKQPLYFRSSMQRESQSIGTIQQDFYGISLFGGDNYSHVSLKRLYNHFARPCFEKYFPHSQFQKIEYLLHHKLADQKH